MDYAEEATSGKPLGLHTDLVIDFLCDHGTYIEHSITLDTVRNVKGGNQLFLARDSNLAS